MTLIMYMLQSSGRFWTRATLGATQTIFQPYNR